MSFVRFLQAGINAAWTRRWRNQSDVDQVDQSIGQDGFYSRNVGDTIDMHLMGYDADDAAKHFDQVITPLRSSATCHLYPNGNMVTTPFFVNPTNRPLHITGIQCVFTTAGTVAGAAGKITHETALSGTAMQAAGAGVTVMSGTFNLHATAETTQTGVLAANYLLSSRNVPSNAASPGCGVIVLQPGDSLSAVFSGTLTTLAGVTITLYFAPGAKYHFVSYYLAAAGAATTTSLMIACRKRTLLFGAATWQTAEATAATLTLDATKDATATAPGAGTSVLASTVNLKSAAKTYTQLALSATAANLLFGPTDSIAIKVSASTTELAGLLVTLAFDGKQGEVQVDYNSRNSTVGTNEEFWIADRDYLITDFANKFSTAGGSGARVGVTVDTGTQTPSTGQVAQTDNSNAGFDVTGTANTPVFATLSALNTRYLRAGDRLGILNGGTVGSLAGDQISIRLSSA